MNVYRTPEQYFVDMEADLQLLLPLSFVNAPSAEVVARSISALQPQHAFKTLEIAASDHPDALEHLAAFAQALQGQELASVDSHIANVLGLTTVDTLQLPDRPEVPKLEAEPGHQDDN